MKRCSKCMAYKRAEEYYAHGQKKDGLRPDCKACTNTSVKKYRKDNPEKKRDRDRRWRSNNPGKASEYGKRWRQLHPAVAREKRKQWNDSHAEEKKALGRKYRKTHNEEIRAKSHRRRALKSGASIGDHFTDLQIFHRDKWICQICHEKVNWRLRHPHPMSKSLDHIIPLAPGDKTITPGSHSWQNCCLTHLH